MKTAASTSTYSSSATNGLRFHFLLSILLLYGLFHFVALLLPPFGRGGVGFFSYYSLFFVSIQMVTGPSFSSSTFMSAPNSPVATCLPSCWLKSPQKAS